MQNPSTTAAPRLVLAAAFLAFIEKVVTQNMGITRL
jgi:hypothetical protein